MDLICIDHTRDHIFRRVNDRDRKRPAGGKRKSLAPVPKKSDIVHVPAGKGSIVPLDPLQLYMQEVRGYPLLTPEEERVLSVEPE